jgi:hypothetical protein
MGRAALAALYASSVVFDATNASLSGECLSLHFSSRCGLASALHRRVSGTQTQPCDLAARRAGVSGRLISCQSSRHCSHIGAWARVVPIFHSLSSHTFTDDVADKDLQHRLPRTRRQVRVSHHSDSHPRYRYRTSGDPAERPTPLRTGRRIGDYAFGCTHRPIRLALH